MILKKLLYGLQHLQVQIHKIYKLHSQYPYLENDVILTIANFIKICNSYLKNGGYNNWHIGGTKD